MIIDGVHLAVTRAWVEDALALRIMRQRLCIEDLFIVTHAPSEKLEGDGFLDTPFGKLRIFWRNDMPKDKLAQILHLSKFEYPRKGNRLVIANMTTNEAHQKSEIPKDSNLAIKQRHDFSDEVKNAAAQAVDELNREGFSDVHKKPTFYDGNGDLIN